MRKLLVTAALVLASVTAFADAVTTHPLAAASSVLATPFERFPANIRADTDILHITRTWTFTRAEQVIAE